MSETRIFILRLLIALACGCAIGYERTNRNKEAGIRTHAIVAIASALMMIISKYGFDDVNRYDASRIASQVVSGIGFLGAGIIFVRNNNMISGLTTSAGLWATSGVGMSIGSGLIFLGITVTVLLIGLQVILHNSLLPINKEDTYKYIIFLKMKEDLKGFSKVKDKIIDANVQIENINISKKDDYYSAEIDILADKAFDKLSLTQDLLNFEKIIYLKII